MPLLGDIEDNFRNLRDTALLQQRQKTEQGNCSTSCLATISWIDIICTNELMAMRQTLFNEIENLLSQV